LCEFTADLIEGMSRCEHMIPRILRHVKHESQTDE
jgi:hypothetical protein